MPSGEPVCASVVGCVVAGFLCSASWRSRSPRSTIDYTGKTQERAQIPRGPCVAAIERKCETL